MKSTAKTVGVVMLIMLGSRLLALLSNLLFMPFFGVNIETEIYSYAIQLPNIIFTILGTALATIIIPIFAGHIGTGEKQKAFKFADNVLSLSVVFTIVLALICIAAAPLILLVIPRFGEARDFALTAFRIMFPIMVFYALNYVLQGILQSLGKFNMPALVSVPSSLIIIFYIVFLGKKFGVIGLVIATFIGLSSQALILIPPILKTEYRFRPSFDYKNEDIQKALRLIPPVLIGTSAYQINMLFNNTLSANFKDTVAIMIWVQNLVLYAILAFIYSITAVIFPKFTMLAAKNDMAGFKDTLLKVLKTIAYFLIPATAGFVAIRYQLVDFLVGWGKVTGNNISLASGMLAFYAIGITGIGIKEVVDRAFYSLKDTKRPAFNGVGIVVVNISLSLLFINFIGVLGIPLAYSISALAGALMLIYLIRKKIGPFGGKSLVFFIAKVLTASVIMLAVIIPVIMFIDRYGVGFSIIDKAIRLFVPAMLGGLVYYISTYLLKVEEAIDVLNKVKAKLKLG